MQIIEVDTGYADENLYGVVVRFQMGARTYSSYVDLLRDKDVLNAPIEVTDESTTLPVQIPTAFKNQIFRAAVEYKNSN